MEFTELNLHPDLHRGLTEAGYITCTPVQEQVLQNAFSGKDLYVQSQTGTGKTAAFLVVIFQRLMSEAMLHGKKAIIMVPTRELAVQVEEEAKLLGKYLPFKTGSFYGGVGYSQQMAFLRNDVQIMVGTPGRVLDLNQSGKMNLMEIAFLILDEADRMFDMGFYPDLRKLIRAVPPADRRQTMLFSATLNAWVKNLAWEYTRNPFEIAIEPETVTLDEVNQVLYHVSSSDKMKLLIGILKREDPESTLVFCNTKRYAEIVAKRLRLNGIECEYIMGDLPQPMRLKIIDNMKTGKMRVLVATDVAARGLDIEDLALVVNYDLPNETENYVHRIGRTARAGKTGKAISFASEQDVYELPSIERYINRKIPAETATEELFTEDKSEGKYIQTDYYDDGDDRSGFKDKRRDRQDRKPRPFEKRSGSQRDSSRRPAGKPMGRSMGKPAGEPFRKPAGRQARNSAEDVSKNSARGFPGGVNLSALSLDERMAYYRQKYDKSGASQGTQKAQKANTPQETKRSGKRRDKKRKPRSAHGEVQQASPQTETSAASSAPAQGQLPAKKSVLSRLAGLFRKKGEGKR